jgi:hypothetical protein
MSYWACAQLETRRERAALHFLGLNGFTTSSPVINKKPLHPSLIGLGFSQAQPLIQQHLDRLRRKVFQTHRQNV